MIDADSFFKSVFTGGYADTFDWKNAHPQTSYYDVELDCRKCSPQSFHYIRVYVVDGKHLISENTAQQFYKRHYK